MATLNEIEFVNALWTRFNDVFVTEASTIGFGRYESMTCPGCSNLMMLSLVKFRTVKENGEIITVEGVHEICGSKLEIHND